MRISDWSSDVCSSDLVDLDEALARTRPRQVDPDRQAVQPHPHRRPRTGRRGVRRSEEHTSELQSLMRISYAVFSLKKKKTNKPKLTTVVEENKCSTSNNRLHTISQRIPPSVKSTHDH